MTVDCKRNCSQNVRRALESINLDEIRFDELEPEPEGDGEFWARLGFRRFPEGLFKVTKQICRYRLGLEEWTLPGMRDKVPENVHPLAPHMYVQEQDGGAYVGIGRFAFEDRWYDFEAYLDEQKAARILSGYRQDVEALEQELESGARQKHERALEAERIREAEGLQWKERFHELLEKFADLELSVQDSVDAGNCEPGTDRFVRRHFPGRQTVTVRELSQHLGVWGVQRVLEHKLLGKEKPEVRMDDGEDFLETE